MNSSLRSIFSLFARRRFVLDLKATIPTLSEKSLRFASDAGSVRGGSGSGVTDQRGSTRNIVTIWSQGPFKEEELLRQDKGPDSGINKSIRAVNQDAKAQKNSSDSIAQETGKYHPQEELEAARDTLKPASYLTELPKVSNDPGEMASRASYSTVSSNIASLPDENQSLLQDKNAESGATSGTETPMRKDSRKEVITMEFFDYLVSAPLSPEKDQQEGTSPSPKIGLDFNSIADVVADSLKDPATKGPSCPSKESEKDTPFNVEIFDFPMVSGKDEKAKFTDTDISNVNYKEIQIRAQNNPGIIEVSEFVIPGTSFYSLYGEENLENNIGKTAVTTHTSSHGQSSPKDVKDVLRNVAARNRSRDQRNQHSRKELKPLTEKEQLEKGLLTEDDFKSVPSSQEIFDRIMLPEELDGATRSGKNNIGACQSNQESHIKGCGDTSESQAGKLCLNKAETINEIKKGMPAQKSQQNSWPKMNARPKEKSPKCDNFKGLHDDCNKKGESRNEIKEAPDGREYEFKMRVTAVPTERKKHDLEAKHRRPLLVGYNKERENNPGVSFDELTELKAAIDKILKKARTEIVITVIKKAQKDVNRKDKLTITDVCSDFGEYGPEKYYAKKPLKTTHEQDSAKGKDE